ncbi:MAG: LacI family DNA-binding transcriptional regulator [Spirochaetales bacterium]|nr:LacI family DNA-binding transcriptional regulator [Spirochaetales bacterium]
MKVRIEDVASEAGVSIATVSRVLNDHPVSEKARRNVEDAIAKLDYSPNLTARGLIKGKSSRVGAIVYNLENPYNSAILSAIERRLRQDGYLCNFASSTLREKEESDTLKRLLDSGVEGLIIVDVDLKSENSGMYAAINKHMPVVQINGNPDRTDTNCIMVDQKFGMSSVMDYFFELNHRDILFIRGELPSLSSNQKEKVFRARMNEQDYDLDEYSILKVGLSNLMDGIDETRQKFCEVWKKGRKPTAVFSCNEIMAIGVVQASWELELKIPEDFSLISHDNTFLSQLSNPPITTVDMTPARLGYESAEMMIQLLKHDDPIPRKLIFYPELIKRASCRSLE